MSDYLEDEERFFAGGKREGRKERKEAQVRDRSKYKKSDRDQKKGVGSARQGSFRGRVLSISLSGISVLAEDNLYTCALKGSLKKERTKEKNLVIVGDWAQFDKKGEGEGIIVGIEARRSYLARPDNLSRKKRQLIAANIDQVFIVMSLVSPPFKPLLVDRYILATREGG